MIDFAEGGVNTFYHNKFYDIVKYVADVRHTHQAVALVMSKAAWQKQDAAGQKAIMDAWAHAREFNRKFILDEDKTDPGPGARQGRHHHQARRRPFRQATQSVYEDFYATPAGKDARKIVDSPERQLAHGSRSGRAGAPGRAPQARAGSAPTTRWAMWAG